MNMTPSNSTLHFSSEPKPDPLAGVKAAHAAGKRIEARQYPPGSHAWHCVKHPSWDSTHFEWRVAPLSLKSPRMVPKLYLVSEDGGETWKKTEVAK